MTEEDLIAKLSKLRTLKPGEGFSRLSKNAIMGSSRRKATMANRWNFSRTLNYGASLLLASLIVILVFGRGNPDVLVKETKTPATGLNLAVVNEASAAIKDINVQLSQAQYFNSEVNNTNQALGVAASSSEETKPAAPKTPTAAPAPTIDQMLNQAAQ